METSAAGTYCADWDSLNARECPGWWQDAKFGVFIFWGVYSVPAFAPTDAKSVYDCYAEHYARFLELAKKPAFREFHAKHYPGRTYRELAEDFTARDFDATRWADVFRRSGAKYVVLSAKHHDGYALWPTATAPGWNSGEVGPKRDLCGELSAAVKAAGLRMGFYYSLLEWFNPLYTDDIATFVEKVNFPQMKELVTRYEPDIFYADGEWDHPWQTLRSPQFLAWLYNESSVRDHVVVNDRWGKKFRGHCGDYQTTEYDDLGGGADALANHPWEECRGMGRSFGYNRFERAENYASVADLLETLVEKVARGGNLLLDVGPDANGQIPPIMEERLLEMGEWLKVNGEAIYATRSWKGRPKTMREDHLYFTRRPEALFAIATRWPQGPMSIRNPGKVTCVSLLGSAQPVEWRLEGDTVVIRPPTVNPGNAPCRHAWVFRLSLAN